jgi:hypothetical protein
MTKIFDPTVTTVGADAELGVERAERLRQSDVRVSPGQEASVGRLAAPSRDLRPDQKTNRETGVQSRCVVDGQNAIAKRRYGRRAPTKIPERIALRPTRNRSVPPPPRFGLAELTDDHLLTSRELAGWLRIAMSTLEDWRYQHVDRGPKWLMVAGMVRYRVGDVRKWRDEAVTGGDGRSTDVSAKE